MQPGILFRLWRFPVCSTFPRASHFSNLNAFPLIACLPRPTAYTDIAPYSYWKITIDKRSSPSEEWQPHVCPAAAFGVACNQPPLAEHTTSQIRVTWTPRNASKPFAAWREGTPVDFVVRLDYHPVSAVDRGWRKKNGAYPQVSHTCMRVEAPV